MSIRPRNATEPSMSPDEHLQPDIVSDISRDDSVSIQDSISIFDRHVPTILTRNERIPAPNAIEIAANEHSTLPPDPQRRLLAEPKVANSGNTDSIELRSPQSFWALKGRTTTVIVLCYLAGESISHQREFCSSSFVSLRVNSR